MYNIAYEIAKKYHNGQKYGDHDYMYHLEQVVNIVVNHNPERFAGDNIKSIAILHDILEDTSCTSETLRKYQINEYIIKSIELVTDGKEGSRYARKQAVNNRLSMVSGIYEIALIVKAADRLANVRDATDSYLKMYKSEHTDFKNAVYRKELCDSIWLELDRRICK